MLGLESVDPPGLQLKGAAFASRRMSPWVQQSDRAGFERAVDAMADAQATTRDHGKVSDDSRTVSGGMEVQRDRIPRANELLAAKAYRLPGPERTLALDPNHESAWDDQVREFFAVNLRARQRWIGVTRLAGGRSGAVVYRVTDGPISVPQDPGRVPPSTHRLGIGRCVSLRLHLRCALAWKRRTTRGTLREQLPPDPARPTCRRSSPAP